MKFLKNSLKIWAFIIVVGLLVYFLGTIVSFAAAGLAALLSIPIHVATAYIAVVLIVLAGTSFIAWRMIED